MDDLTIHLSEGTKKFIAQLVNNNQQVLEMLGGIERQLNKVLAKEKSIMASVQDVLDKIAAQKTEIAKIAADLAVYVQQLKDAIAAGTDLTAIVDALDGVSSDLTAVDDAIPEQTPTP